MRGTILQYTSETHNGLISGHDGKRYNFTRTEWKEETEDPEKGQNIDFVIKKDVATSIILLDAPNKENSKNKLIAALLAILLGWLGGHKFYLGQTGWGIAYLLLCWTGIPFFISVIECLYLLAMDEKKFNARFN